MAGPGPGPGRGPGLRGGKPGRFGSAEASSSAIDAGVSWLRALHLQFLLIAADFGGFQLGLPGCVLFGVTPARYGFTRPGEPSSTSADFLRPLTSGGFRLQLFVRYVAAPWAAGVACVQQFTS